MKSLLITILFLGLSLTAQANQSSQVSKIVDDYYAMKTLKLVGQKHDCYPQGQSCFRTACETVGVFECDDQDEMNQLRKACRGVWGDSCLKTGFKYLGKFEYDDNDEMVLLVNSCRGVYDVGCIEYTCDRLGRFDCDDLEEIRNVNLTCAGNL